MIGRGISRVLYDHTYDYNWGAVKIIIDPSEFESLTLHLWSLWHVTLNLTYSIPKFVQFMVVILKINFHFLAYMW